MFSAYGKFDYIIVGAGSAGCVLANRLSENPQNKVLLIEAGGRESNFSDIPGLFIYLQGLQYNWNYVTTKQTTSCLGKNIYCKIRICYLKLTFRDD